jgi:hypothetical protein
VELWLEQSEDVSAALDQLGLALQTPLPKAERYLLWSWPKGDRDRSTRTLRIEGGDDVLPLLPAPGVPIVLSAVTAGPASFADERVDAELAVTFEAGTPATTDYRQRLDAWFDRHREPLIELRSKTALWNWSVYGAGVSIPPLTFAYAAAAAREQQGIDAEACGRQLRSLDRPDAAPPSACGPARDVELALSAAGTESATLERFVIAGRVGVTPALLAPGGDVRAPILRAKSASGASCTSADAPVNAGPVPVVTEPSTGRSEEAVVERAPVTAPPVEASCSSSTQSESDESDSCSSDSSGSQSSESDSCS